MAEGARFEVHLTKARGILGDDAKPFEANLITEGNALHWRVRDIEDVELEELKRLLGEGYSIRDCAEGDTCNIRRICHPMKSGQIRTGFQFLYRVN